MKVTALIENRVSLPDLLAEHGTSFYIETETAKVLFDTGASGNFNVNATNLGIDLSQIDILVISHGHCDHVGGLHHFLQVNRHAQVFMKKGVLDGKYKYEKHIGITAQLSIDSERFHFPDKIYEIVKGIYLLPEIDIHFPTDQHKKGFFTIQNSKIIHDEFHDELFMVLKTEKGISILSSCSHNGISNMIETASLLFKLPVLNVIGGFHIKDSPPSITDHLSDYFNKNEIQEIHTCHCTGLDKYMELKTKCQAQVTYFETGDVIDIGNQDSFYIFQR